MASATIQRSILVPSSPPPRPPRGPVRPRHGRRERQRRPIAAAAREAVRATQTRHAAHTPPLHPRMCCAEPLGVKLPLSKVPRRDPRVLFDRCLSQWACARRNRTKITITRPKPRGGGAQDRRNITEGQPPHNRRVRSRRQRLSHMLVRLPGCYTPRPTPCDDPAPLQNSAATQWRSLRLHPSAVPAPPSQQWQPAT